MFRNPFVATWTLFLSPVRHLRFISSKTRAQSSICPVFAAWFSTPHRRLLGRLMPFSIASLKVWRVPEAESAFSCLRGIRGGTKERNHATVQHNHGKME